PGLEQEYHFVLEQEHPVPLEPRLLAIERRSVRDQLPRFLERALLERNRNEQLARGLVTAEIQAREKLGELRHDPGLGHARNPNGRPYAGLEHEAAAPVDPISRRAADADRTQALQRDDALDGASVIGAGESDAPRPDLEAPRGRGLVPLSPDNCVG